eukprot:NODE_9455_length_590_cov_18.329764_g8820_i0.p1 GENE.NODE_9455_length_590_cov_18.329764_g8820_i0~~NODE_9455_length_590_cov_18.329764_g8820_i0.p1  ORF type:complete len:143 (-),score=39.62 NODE_9455_length_590_cov_18.329764_g8820_i0:90-518(-)
MVKFRHFVSKKKQLARRMKVLSEHVDKRKDWLRVQKRKKEIQKEWELNKPTPSPVREWLTVLGKNYLKWADILENNGIKTKEELMAVKPDRLSQLITDVRVRIPLKKILTKRQLKWKSKENLAIEDAAEGDEEETEENAVES